MQINESSTINNEFMIKGTAINAVTTRNGHTFLAEELSISASSLKGRPLLKDHTNTIDSIIGKVIDAFYEPLSESIKFTASIFDESIKQKIKAGLINSVSVGANVKDIDRRTLERIEGSVFESISELPTEITNDSFKARGEILSNGNTTLTEYGFIYIKSPTLTTIELGTANIQKESFTTNILGAFNKTIQSLDPDSRYIYRAYASNSIGTDYGATQSLITSSFITIGNPELITIIQSITTTTINAGGNIVSTGNIDIKEYGIIAHNSVTFSHCNLRLK
jgi:hypothetical protein